ncbi:hypothetical protein AM1_A0339 (plasmid) [Acaryochloris marina MBIC11017]|uniref:Uncharacterized protein n=1 Tax=Acaryochloris marina (strain MBIC 11017) TaxID=329726 RepID=A8ZKY9_ACAM1|nr:hypothetical protein AM1_A0339 [Acaryochloris marina MBIC11017]
MLYFAPIDQPHPYRSSILPDDCPKAFLGLSLLEINQLEGAAIPDFDFSDVDFHGITSSDSEGSPPVVNQGLIGVGRSRKEKRRKRKVLGGEGRGCC